MSFYNLMHGFNAACIVLMPMLGRKQEEYPRFRDCFLSEDEKRIVILTRVGGGNRKCGFGEEKLYADPNFFQTYDCDFDSTYGYYEFNVPEKWKDDFQKIVDNKFIEVSDDYVNYLSEFYPTLAKKGLFQKLFRTEEE